MDHFRRSGPGTASGQARHGTLDGTWDMISPVYEDESDRGRARYTLAETRPGHAWGVCAEMEGLFGVLATAYHQSVQVALLVSLGLDRTAQTWKARLSELLVG